MMLLTLRKAMITRLAGTDIAVLMNVPELFVSLDWLKKVPASSVVHRGILKTRTRTVNGHRYSQQNGDG